MASELITIGTSGLTLDAYLYSPAGLIWRTDTHVFESPLTANWSHYVIPLVEVSTTGTYEADFPTQITAAGTYPYVVRTRSGSADPADVVYALGEVKWDGSAVATSGSSVTTRSYVKTANGYTDNTYDDLIDQLLPGVTKGIAKMIRRNPVASTITEIRDGGGKDWLRVWNPPINSITSITFDLDGSGETTISGSQFKSNSDTGVIKFKPTAQVQYGFADGFQNIKVIYSGGWIDIPEDIQTAAALVIRKLIEIYDSERLVSEKVIGSRKVRFDTLYSAAQSGDGPVYTEAKELLQPYVLVRCL